MLVRVRGLVVYPLKGRKTVGNGVAVTSFAVMGFAVMGFVVMGFVVSGGPPGGVMVMVIHHRAPRFVVLIAQVMRQVEPVDDRVPSQEGAARSSWEFPQLRPSG